MFEMKYVHHYISRGNRKNEGWEKVVLQIQSSRGASLQSSLSLALPKQWSVSLLLQ